MALGMGKPTDQVTLSHPFATDKKVFKDSKSVTTELDRVRGGVGADARRGNLFVFDLLLKKQLEVAAA